MQTYISILRGINVSGQKKILMADLKNLYEGLQFKDVATYIQSGNVVFKSGGKFPGTSLATKIEKAINKQYGFEVPVITRTAEEMREVVANNPFLANKNLFPEKLHVTFLSEVPEQKLLDLIKSFDYSPDQFCIIDKHVFLYIPESYGETKLSNKFFENKLKVTATTRNWKTVNTLFEMASKK